jgi:NADH dehydrogenase [ubiquinone] 1 alpha subcomplex assembly factor 1
MEHLKVSFMIKFFQFSQVRYTYTAIKMEGGNPSRAPRTLWRFHSQEELTHYAVGCDADIGGTSTCNLTMGEDGKARFWGDMRLAVKPGLERKIRGGYAGFRNKVGLPS